MEKYGLKKFIQKKLNIPITPENVYTNTSIGKGDAKDDAKDDAKYKMKEKSPSLERTAKYLDELYSTSFVDDYFS
jgi:hypothetical protein